MLKNSLYNLVGFVLRSGFTFLTVPLLIRIIGVQEYGLWTLVSTVLSILALAEGGLSVSTTVFLSQELAQENRQGVSQVLSVTLGGMLILASLAGLSLWVGSGQILNLFPILDESQRSDANLAFKWASLVIVARLIQQIMAGVEQACKRYDWINIVATLQIVIVTSGMLAIAYKGGNIVSLMQWQVAVAILLLFLHSFLAYSLLAPYHLEFSWNSSKAWEICRYSAATWVTGLGSAIFQQGDRLIVGSILGTKLLGVYGAITTVASQINSFSATAIQPILPRMSELLQGSRDRLESEIERATQANFSLVLGLAGSILLLSHWLVFALFGEYNSEYQLTLAIATLAYGVYSLNAVGYYIILGLGYANLSMVIAIASSIISLILIFGGAKIWGITGATWGNIGYAFTLSYVAISMKLLNISLAQWFSWLQPQALWSFYLSIFKKIHSHK